jgi:hypothetical protein
VGEIIMPQRKGRKSTKKDEILAELIKMQKHLNAAWKIEQKLNIDKTLKNIDKTLKKFRINDPLQKKKK